jgi:hypothetical protein
MKNNIICPLCGATCPHKIVGKTHTWSCSQCPFVGLEYYDNMNTYDLHCELEDSVCVCAYHDEQGKCTDIPN